MNSSSPVYSVVIPVYNSVQSLEKLCGRLEAVFSSMGDSFEIVFVDDCSPNRETWPKLEDLCNRDYVRAVRFSRNFGQQPATICGLEKARGSWVITMDDDGQHAPEDIPKLLRQKQHDVVIGELREKKHNLRKRILSRIKGRFDRIILDKPRDLKLSAFRLINRNTVDGMLKLKETPYPFIPAMMFYVTKDVVGVSVDHFERTEGTTGYTFRSMLRLFQNLLINNSSLLLRYIGNLGVSIAALSFLFSAYLVFRKLFMDIVAPGWTSVMVTVLFIGGLILFSLGVIGEYLIRIINTVERRPIYLIRDERGNTDEA
ncbi:MAG: glycosyltransferase family 2 protein [Flavobacteriales bacterium]|nr:glycosyltransferase family 2 protein [Flavobacteriales bacterium]